MPRSKASALRLNDLQTRLTAAASQLKLENPGLIGDEADIGFIPGHGIIGFVAPESALEAQNFAAVSKLAVTTAAKFGPIAAGAQPSIILKDKKVIIGFVAPHDIFRA